MQLTDTIIPKVFAAFFLLLATTPPLCAEGPATAADYYTEPPLYNPRPDPKSESKLGSVGVTGVKLRVYPCVVLKGKRPIIGGKRKRQLLS